MNNKEVATDVLKAVGGKENVENVIHCVTRLRFTLKNTSIPNTEEIKKIDGVITVIEHGGQYQVVIGNNVEPVFSELIKLIGEPIEDEKNIEENGEKKKVKLFDLFTATISGIFTPILGIVAGTGMLKGILAILTVAGVLKAGMGTYDVLYAISNTVFYFFPIFLGAAAAKHFKMNQYLGMAIGGAMVYPTLVAIAAKATAITFIGLPMNVLDYTSSVFPVIVAVWLASKLEKKLNKIIPQGVKFFVVPLIVLSVMVPLTLFLVGPVLTFLSKVLSDGTIAVYNFNSVLGGIVLGGPWILIVMFGLHWAFIPIFINNVVHLGSDSMLALLTANQFAMAGAAIAVALKTKDLKLKSLSWSSFITCIFGVSEPTIYGILVPLKKPLIMAIIGGSAGGAVAGIFKSRIYAFGASGILQFPLAINPKGLDMGFYGIILSSIVGFGVAFVLTFLFGYSNKKKEI